jgi:hypothetical protein
MNHPKRVTTAHPVERHAEGDEFTYLRRRSLKMAISDELTKLATRASEAEKRGAEARQKARADLEQDVSTARATAQADNERFRERAEENRTETSARWADVQKAWNARVAAVREDIEAKKEEHDVHRAERKAEDSESDALYAIDFAYTAIEEAEYAALYAVARRMKADELSASHPGA